LTIAILSEDEQTVLSGARTIFSLDDGFGWDVMNGKRADGIVGSTDNIMMDLDRTTFGLVG
jgi:hypothetical protein